MEGETVKQSTPGNDEARRVPARQTSQLSQEATRVRNWRILSRLNRALLSANSYEDVARLLVEPSAQMSFEGVLLFAVHQWDEEGRPEAADVYLEFRPEGEEEELSMAFPDLPLSPRTWCEEGTDPIFFWDDVRALADRAQASSVMMELIERFDIRNAFSIHLCRRGKFVGMLVFFARGGLMEDRWKTRGTDMWEAELILAEAVVATLERLTAERLRQQSHKMLLTLYRALADINAAGDYEEVIAALQRHTVLKGADLGVGLVAFSPFWGAEPPQWAYPLAVHRGDGGGDLSTLRYPFNELGLLKDWMADVHVVRLENPAELLEGDLRALFEQLFGDLEPIRRMLLLPLIARGERIGFVAAGFSHSCGCTGETEHILEVLGEQAAATLRAIIRITTTEMQALKLRTASDVAQAATAIAATVNLDELLYRVADLVRRRFDLYYVGIFLVDEAGEWAVLRAGTGEAGRKMLENHHRLRVGGRSMIGTCIATGQPRIALDVGQEAVRFDNPFLPETRSEMALPIQVRGQVIGAMTIQSAEQAAFSEEDITILQTVANQLANAIENVQLFAQVQSSLAELEALQRQMTAESWAEFTSQQELVGYGYDLHEITPLAGGVITESLPDRVIVEEAEGGVVVKAPIAVRGFPVGMLEIDQPLEFDPYSQDDLALIERVRGQLAMALENRILFERTRSALAETRLLYETGQKIGTAETPEEILATMVEGLAQRPEPLYIEVLRFGEATDGVEEHRPLHLVVAWDRNRAAPVPREHTIRLEELGELWDRLTARWMVYLPDLAAEAHLAPSLASYYYRHAESLALFLITIQREPYAVVAVSMDGGESFAEERRRVYDAMLYTASVALANRLLLQRTQQEAERRAFLNEVMSTAASHLDPDRLLAAVGELIARRYRMPVMLFRWVEDRLQAVAIYEEDGEMWESLIGHRFRLIDLPGIGAVVRLRQPLLWHFDARPYRSTIFESILDHLKLEAAYSVPLMLRDEVLGVLVLGRPEGHPPVDAEEMATLQNAAVNIGVAVENARLYQEAQETAEKLKEVDRLKSEFLASMSHELRTPLNSIIGFSRVILKGIDGPLTEMQKTDLTAIYESGRHLLNLINDILDLSKIEAGKMEFIFEQTDLREVIQGVLTTATALVKDKPIKLISDVPDDLPMILADTRRIRQVILNLVGNAAKFTEKGHIRVSATYNEREVIIAVEDTGIGIPEDKYHLVFQEFQQVDSSSTRRYGGTGLGLPVSKRFVEAHGGRIWFESKEGVGSTFYVALPIGGPESVKAEEEPEVEEGENRLVLVIDDDPAVVTLFRRYLEGHGYQVVGLTQPTRAVEEVKRLKPYAVTLDLMMPEMDGWQVLQALKSDPATRDVPVVICSIAGDGVERGIAMGVTDYLVKPVTEESLFSALERLAYTDDIYRILVVDDSAGDRKLLRRILESAGHLVEEAADGQQAIEMVEDSPPDLVLLDLMMPGMDGAAVLAHLKADPRTRRIPVIIVTAKELDEAERKRLLEQSEELLQKGQFNDEELLRDVVDVLNRLRVRREEENEEGKEQRA